MAVQLWRTTLGLWAVVIWAVVIGVPVLIFHVSSPGLGRGEHLHSAILYFASQLLVFWMVARPSRKQQTTGVTTAPASPAAKVVEQICCAELVAEIANETVSTTADSSTPISQEITVKMVIGNYLGSSRTRIVYIEPGGSHYELLPGQELQIQVTSGTSAPSLRVIESDIATQVCIEGSAADVVVSLVGK